MNQEPQENWQDLVTKFQDKQVRVFLYNGRTLCGKITFNDGWARVEDSSNKKTAMCNLQHVISICLG